MTIMSVFFVDSNKRELHFSALKFMMGMTFAYLVINSKMEKIVLLNLMTQIIFVDSNP
tara:strand:- start:785 stop:958 length:174 start_codon:yes stop_codon:yes gene_type:complete